MSVQNATGTAISIQQTKRQAAQETARQSVDRIVFQGRVFLVTVKTTSGRQVSLPTQIFQEVSQYCMQYMQQNQNTLKQKSRVVISPPVNPDSRSRNLFEKVKKTAAYTYVNYGRTGVTRPERPRKPQGLLNLPLLSNNLVTGLRRPKGYQTCWAHSLLQMLINDKEFTSAIKKAVKNQSTLTTKALQKVENEKQQLEGQLAQLPQNVQKQTPQEINDSIREKESSLTAIREAGRQNDDAAFYTTTMNEIAKEREALTLKRRIEGIEQSIKIITQGIPKKLAALAKVIDDYEAAGGKVLDIEEQIEIIFNHKNERNFLYLPKDAGEEYQKLLNMFTVGGVVTEPFQATGYMIPETINQQFLMEQHFESSLLSLDLCSNAKQNNPVKLEDIIEKNYVITKLPQISIQIKLNRHGNSTHAPIDFQAHNTKGTLILKERDFSLQGAKAPLKLQTTATGIEKVFELTAFTLHSGHAQTSSGVVTAGHYTSCVKKYDVEKNIDQWFYIDDHHMSEITEAEAFARANRATDLYFTSLKKQ